MQHSGAGENLFEIQAERRIQFDKNDRALPSSIEVRLPGRRQDRRFDNCGLGDFLDSARGGFAAPDPFGDGFDRLRRGAAAAAHQIGPGLDHTFSHGGQILRRGEIHNPPADILREAGVGKGGDLGLRSRAELLDDVQHVGHAASAVRTHHVRAEFNEAVQGQIDVDAAGRDRPMLKG